MVKTYLYVLGITILLVGCNEPTNYIQQDQSEGNITMSDTNITNQTKDEHDQEYFKNLSELNLSEEEFLLIAKHIIENIKNKDFKEIDPILGQKEYMMSKDFNDPDSFYHYSNIPLHHGTEVVLKYKKSDESLVSITIRPSGSQNDFILKNSNINIMEALKLKLVKKEIFSRFNQLVGYQLSDGTLNYQVLAKNTQDNGGLPKEFYSFRILLTSTSGM